ncbi:GrdX family protein [Caldanaerobacter sp.]|uniref:GrdX family protein n=1 Tax=Caldanaerobacter sp. TaxID=2930036 RepID=UPI003C75A5FC
MKYVIVTNNPLVRDVYPQDCEFIEGTIVNVLTRCRDLIHKGYVLMSHPLAGNVKPDCSPFKSVLLKESKGTVDFNSVVIIEGCLLKVKEIIEKEGINYIENEKVLNDLAYLDKELIKEVIETFRE